MAHFITALSRCRTRRAVSGLSCQMGVRIASTSAVVTMDTDRAPRRGNAYARRAARPFPRVFGVSPAAALLRQHCGGRLLDRGQALAVALFGQRVPACSCSLTVGDCRRACLGQGHQGVAAEPEHAGVTSNNQSLHPPPRPGRIHAQVQPVAAVAMEAGRGGAHKGSTEALCEAAWGTRERVSCQLDTGCIYQQKRIQI